MSEDKATHWQSVYETKASTDVSWFRPHLDVSLALLKNAGLNTNSRVIDIGGGASTLVDDLIDLGVLNVSVLDLAATSLTIARQRLGPRGARVQWIVGDAAQYKFAPDSFDLWHDRAALHFLVNAADTSAYVDNATRAIQKGGFAVIGGFASDGPEQCSGLPVARRDPADIAKLFGAAFILVDQRREVHPTPKGALQSFAYALLRKK